MYATIVNNKIKITALHNIEGMMVIETSCSDYEKYRSLPDLIEYNGVLFGKTGWSSDKEYACYKSNPIVADHFK